MDRAHIPAGGLAIVGSRHADASALAYAQSVAEHCAKHRITVVSGGARGVDVTAMESALEAGGPVVGVLADSLAKTASSRRFRSYLTQGMLTLLPLTILIVPSTQATLWQGTSSSTLWQSGR